MSEAAPVVEPPVEPAPPLPAEHPAEPPEDKTIAAGAEPPAEPPAATTDWPEDWREKIAEHAGAGDKKAVARELKRLQRFTDPMSIYGSARELEAKFSEGNLTKIPGPDADEKEIAAYRKAIGVPEEVSGYTDNIELANGMVVGEADKPAIDFYAQIAHDAGMAPDAFNKLVQGYYDTQEDQAATLDQSDNDYRAESSRVLREAYGASLDRNIQSLSRLFAETPGGADLENPNSLMSLVFGARLGDGTLAGDNPEVIQALVNWTKQIHPLAAVTEGGNQSGQSVDDELESIRGIMRTDRPRYNKDTKMQARYLELIGAQQAHQARN